MPHMVNGGLFVAQAFATAGRFLAQPRETVWLNSKLSDLSGRIHFVPDIHSGEVLAQVRSTQPDLGLIYGSPILKPELFQIPGFGTLGIHHGKVPKYRGKKTTFWAMYNGEEEAGVTIQRVNAGLDKGEIVKEAAVEVGRRSQRSVWRELSAIGLDLYIQAVIDVKRGTIRYRPQEGPGELYRDPGLGHILTFWWRHWKRRFGRAPVSSAPPFEETN